MNEELSFKLANPTAQKIMTNIFYWNDLGYSGPFGHSLGYNTFFDFKDWREGNPNITSITYLLEQGIKFFDWYELGFEAISNQIKKMQVSNDFNMNKVALELFLEQDNVIISTGFSQLYLEGHIDSELLEIVLIALNRQTQTVLLDLYEDSEIKRQRKFEVSTMLEDLKKYMSLKH